MKSVESARTYFWAYDIFGYLLPGIVLLTVSAVATAGPGALGLESGTSPVIEIAGFLLVSYVVGHLIAALSSLLLERLLVSAWLKYPTDHLVFPSGQVVGWRKYWSYCRAYSSDFRETLLSKFELVFGKRTGDKHDLFWLVWEYVSLYHPVAYKRGTHFLELYGFARNLCMTLFLVTLAPFCPSWSAPTTPPIWIGAFLVASILLFLNYCKFLRRLNDEIYRAFVALLSASPTAPGRVSNEA